jgi:hypothetical protein
MPNTFADELWLFAKTVDLVDSKICDKVRNSVDQYVTQSLRMDYWEVQVDGIRAKTGPGLVTFQTPDGKLWSNDEKAQTPVYNKDGSFTGQTTFAYTQGTPLWITEKNEGELSSDADCVDEWSKTKNLPDYWSYFPQKMKTSIIVPLRDGGKFFGFFTMESDECIHFSKPYAKEITKLTDGIASIIRSHEGHFDQHQNTREAFDIVEDKLVKCFKTPPGTLPQLFLASPSAKGSEEVLGEINSVLDEFGDRINVKYWKDADESGDVTTHIASAIAESRFGICYFSQPDEAPMYKDNPNVLIEAGMIHSLSNDVEAEPTAWIPIREKNSPPMPFDIASQRMIIVPRTIGKTKSQKEAAPYGKLNADRFKTLLRNRIEKLLAE